MNDKAVVLSDKLQGSQNHCFHIVHICGYARGHHTTPVYLKFKVNKQINLKKFKIFSRTRFKITTWPTKILFRKHTFLSDCKNFSHWFVHVAQTSA